jgi:type VI secretion system protein ImpJ
MANVLARIDWKMGQTLLPEHFIAQEDSFSAETALRFSLLGVPFHGIGRLRWNDSLLAEGVVSIMSVAVILPTGQVVQVPGNAEAQSFNLNVAGTTKVTVYLHFTNERAAADGNYSGQSAEDSLERVVHTITLSSEQTLRNAVYTMKFAEFEKDIQGNWSLVTDFMPPLLQVGTSPFFTRTIERLTKTIQLFHEKLREDIAASYLGGEGLFSAKMCLKGVYAIERLLANVKAQVPLHPFQFYEALKTFYTEVCIYQDKTPEEITSPYLHDDIAGCMKKVLVPLFEHLQVSKGKTPYLGFERKDGVFILNNIPPEVRVAKEVYFLVQKPKVSDTVSMDGFKIGSRSRLPVVHQLSLVGIPVRRIDRPPFQHQFGAEVEFYLLSQGDEWDNALKEGSLAFFDTPTFAKAKAYVYWRST